MNEKPLPPLREDLWPVCYAGLLGAFLGLSLLKFGNPFILDRLVQVPANWAEYVYQPWPAVWGYGVLAILALAGLTVVDWKIGRPTWLFWLPLVWFGWQLIAGTQSVEPTLTHGALKHFATCLVCHFLGRLALSQVRNLTLFWCGLLAGMAYVLWFGLNQHYGGLEATRRYFYEQPNWQQFPAEYLKKIASNRIFSTLVYPNALAGAVLLLSPVLLVVAWQMTGHFRLVVRGTATGLLGYTSLACLYWTNSRTGWLIALLMGAMVLLHLPVRRFIKVALVMGILLLGLAAFFVKHSAYFEKGATSVSARFDYWRAAFTTFRARPVFGTGPGTFSVAYKKIKTPESEMAQLAHNDYLQQASDSGFIGFVSYFAFIFGGLGFLYRQSLPRKGLIRFAVWLGLSAWAIQGLTEFGLYIPGLAWPAFMLFGWLAATTGEIKSTNVALPGKASHR